MSAKTSCAFCTSTTLSGLSATWPTAEFELLWNGHQSFDNGLGHDNPVGTRWVDIWGTGWHKIHPGVMGMPEVNPLANPDDLKGISMARSKRPAPGRPDLQPGKNLANRRTPVGRWASRHIVGKGLHAGGNGSHDDGFHQRTGFCPPGAATASWIFSLASRAITSTWGSKWSFLGR